MEEAIVYVGHEMAGFLRGGAYGMVILVKDYAHLIHESDLFLIVTCKICGVIGAVLQEGCWLKIFSD